MSPRVLAVHSGALGDVVLFGRLLETLDADVTLIAGGQKACLLADLGVVARALDFDSLPMADLFSQVPLETCELGKHLPRCDRLISCFADPGSQPALRLATLAGAESANFLPIRAEADFQARLVDLWTDMLAAGPVADAPPAWPVDGAMDAGARTQLDHWGVTGPFVIIHPGSGGPSKCWPLDGYVALADGLVRAGLAVVFAIGPVEQDLWSTDGRLDRLADWPVARDLPLATLAGLLAKSAGYVGNDSGPSHLAGALGGPTLALFGPTSPVQFAPLGPAVQTLAAERLDQISPEKVAQTLIGMISP